MFEDLQKPFSFAEYETARERATEKLHRIAVRTGKTYDSDYLDELICEEITQKRFEDMTVNGYKKRHIQNECTTKSNNIIPDSSLNVKCTEAANL